MENNVLRGAMSALGSYIYIQGDQYNYVRTPVL